MPTSILVILLTAILFLSTSSPKISSFGYATAATSSSTQSSGNTEKSATYADAGQNFKGLETGTIIGNRVYPVQYENSPSRYDKDISTAQKIIDSFKIENSVNVINR